MINSRRLFSNAALSVVQTLVSAVLLFFLYRYLLDRLGPKLLGIWSLVLASTSVARLSDMGFSGAVVKFVAQHLAQDEQQKVSRIVQTAALSIGLILFIAMLGAYPVLAYILSWAIPKDALPQAIVILPWAVLSLWFGMAAAVFQSALDGCQRIDIRNGILIFCNILYIGFVVWLVPNYGLKGLAQAQLAQSVLLFGLCWFFLRRQLPNLPWIPSRWSRVEFKEMFSYAVHFQIASIVGLFFDPITKFLLSKYGGLSDTAYYEMASQIITKVRAVLISALQVLVPVISGIKNTDYQQLNNIYQKSYRMLFFIVWPYYLCVALAFPLISLVWIGHSESRFIISGQILAVGWLLSSLGLPAYFHNLGTGKIVWNTATQTLTAFLNSLLGWLLGATYGSIGVVIAAMLSLTLPIWLLIFIVQRNLKVDNKELFPKESRRVMMIAIIGAIWGFVFMAYGKIYFSDEVSSSIVLLSYTCFMFLTIHSHPFWKKIQTFLLRR